MRVEVAAHRRAFVDPKIHGDWSALRALDRLLMLGSKALCPDRQRARRLLNRCYWIVKTSVELPRRMVSANAVAPFTA